jgi:predicted TIM-barrel fold metal-dependent hydrolase
MVDRQRVLDADTHFQPAAESVVPYLDSATRARLPELEQFLSEVKIGRASQVLEPPYRHWYRFSHGGGWGSGKPRRLGDAGPRNEPPERLQNFMGERFPAPDAEDTAVDARLKDMDEEGVDVQVLVPSAFLGHEDPTVDMAFIRALHRFLDDTCRQYPDRLKSMIVVSPRDIKSSVGQIKAWAGSSWATGIYPSLPLDYPIDHPDMEPIWAAADEANLAVVHHSFSTGYPGYRDLWDNPFLGRTAGHPWGAQRAVGAFFGAGIMDRYPNLRFAVLECGFGWLPFWAKRMDDQVTYMGYVADGLKHTMSDYMTSGRFFTSIVLHEGPDMLRMVTELLGDHILMFGSDYPHSESRFPVSVTTVDDWAMDATVRRNLMWDNAARCFGI